MISPKKVLFISHEASRTGAPIVLLNLLRWWKVNSDLPFEILIRNTTGERGELLSEFEALAPVTVVNGPRVSGQTSIQRGMRKLADLSSCRYFLDRHLSRQFRDRNISLVYSNTVTNGRMLERLASLDCPVISHVHELDFMIRHHIGMASFGLIKKHSSRYIAASQAVQRNLVENHGIDIETIDVVHEFITLPSACIGNTPQGCDRIRKQLNIPKDALIVGASGTTDWRKGADLFVQLAQAVHRRMQNQPVYFLWVGGDMTNLHSAQILHDAAKLSLGQYFQVLGKVSNPLDFFAEFDIFVLLSREDPFPLVCLEAASSGKPIVCFDNAGGASELIEDDAGFVVPFLDVIGMADKVIDLLRDADLRWRLGKRGAQKVRKRYDTAIGAPKIHAIVQQLI